MPTWIAIAHPGLEPVVADELRELGFAPEAQAGWVRFSAEPRAVSAALPLLRTPDRLLLQIAEARAPGDALASVVRAQDWKAWLTPEATLEVDVHGGGRFKDSVGKRVAWAIQEALKGPRVPERYARPRITQRVSVVLDARTDRVTISLDAGGELLHRRGWRTDVSKAPLRENLAAALLRLSGWRPGTPLVDPFCGSGTIGIEAALQAAGRSPYTRRDLACSEWVPMRPGVGARAGGARPGGGTGGGNPGGSRGPASTARAVPTAIQCTDRDAKVLDAARANAQRAGVDLTFRACDVADLTAPSGRGYVVTNPPWGHRLNGEAGGRVIPATDIFNKFAVTVAERFAGWTVVFLAPEIELARRLSPRVRALATFPNGGFA